jgi:hypothetical protein
LHKLLGLKSGGCGGAWWSSLLSHHLLLHRHLLRKHGLVLLEHLLMEGHLLVDQLLLIHEHLVLGKGCIRRLANGGKGIHEGGCRLSGIGGFNLSFGGMSLCLFCRLSCGGYLFLLLFFILFGCCSGFFTLQFLLCGNCCLCLLLGLIFFSLEAFFLLSLDLLSGSLSKQLRVLIFAVFASDVFLLFFFFGILRFFSLGLVGGG